MLLGDETRGVILLNGRHPGPLGAAEARLLSLIANHVAVVIENARLHEETRRRLAELSALFEVSRALRGARNVEEMLPIILDKSVEVMGAQGGHLALLEDGGQALAVRTTGARILAVVNAYWAITHERVYCKARSRAEAVEELRRNAGTQFDSLRR